MSQKPDQDEQLAGVSRSDRGATGARLFLAILLIVAGLLLFLSNLGLFPLRSVWDLWPLVLVALGLGRWTGRRTLGDRIWSIMMIFFGVVFFCISFGFLHLRAHDGSWPVAVAFIAFGIVALTKVLDGSSTPAAGQLQSRFCGASANADSLADTAVLGSVQRRIESLDFRGGVLTCVLGSIELDLRRAQIQQPSQSVTLETTCVLGSIKLRIPETWRLSVMGVPVLGSYEDKTIPMARPDATTGTLVITGASVLGSVEIEN